MLAPWLSPSFLLGLVCCCFNLAGAYDIVNDFSGISFFDDWDFYGNYDNLTLGDVIWLNRSAAFSEELALVNAAGNVVIRVDNFSKVPFNDKRNSVRITTQDSFELGSLFVINLIHLPYGCSVWPSIWTLGPNWPAGGEIDIIEGINLMQNNQYALHTTSGCLHASMPPAMQTGNSTAADADCSQPSGCIVGETAPNSLQRGFADAGGGVWAAQFDYTGIFIWFWSRPDVPASIQHSTPTSSLDLSDWGPPSASYVNTSCTIDEFFGAQQLVIDITLCGEYAGLPQFYDIACANTGPTGICYNDNVVGDGSNYDEAYFEIEYVRAYTTAAPVSATAVAALRAGASFTAPARWGWLVPVVAGVLGGLMLV